MGKKLPPYGYIFQQNLLSTGIPSYLYIFIGNKAWQLAAKWQPWALVLPPWLSPDVYQWPVKGCRIAIFDTGYAEEDYINDLVIELYSSGATQVQVMSPDYECTTYSRD